ncbi:ABC transporter permease [Acidaminobacterium chupaoyuni]
MLKYILKRILQAIPLLFVITALCFLLINLAPYDAVDAITTPDMSRAEIEQKREDYGLNDPIYVQYGKWLENICHGEFGNSLLSHTSIKYDLKQRIPATIQLVLPAYLTAFCLAIVLGLVAGSHKNRAADKIIDGLSSVGIAMPTFWLALLMMYFFSYRLKIFPLMGMHTIGLEHSVSDYLKHFAMPYIVLTMGFLPDLTRYVRASTIGQLKEDYCLVQEAFGAKKAQILFGHVLRNVLTPLVTKLGMALPMLVTGAVITETIFAWPGIGPYFVKAIQSLDYPIVMSILVLSGTLVILGNLLSDVIYCLTDPRIKTQG